MSIKGSTNLSYLLLSDRKKLIMKLGKAKYVYLYYHKELYIILSNFTSNSLNVHSKIRIHFLVF